MIIGGVSDSKHVIRTAIRIATFSKGNVAQDLRRDSSCATLPFHVLVLRYLLYSNGGEIYKRPKNREDSSDLDEHLTESIAATRTKF